MNGRRPIGLTVPYRKVEDDDDIQDYKKPWVFLTDEEIKDFMRCSWGVGVEPEDFIRAIESKIKEKNT